MPSAVASMAALELDPGSTFELEFYTKRADVLMASGDYNSAIADYTKAIDVDPKHRSIGERRALQIIERDPDAIGKPGERLLSALNSLAAILNAEHRRSDADAVNRRGLGVAQPLEHRLQKKIMDGSPAPSVEASMLGKNSYLFGCGRNWAQVLVSTRDQTDGRDDQPSDRDHVALSHGEDPTDEPLLRARVQALYRMGANESNIRAEGFLAVQRMLLNDAARAVSKLAARFSSGSGTLANLIREQQDRLDRRSNASKLLHDNYEFGQISRIDEPEETLRQLVAEEDKELDAVEAKLREQFPEFIALPHPEPVPIVEVQAQLREDEALVMFKDFEEWANIIPEETFIWIVTKTDSRWVRSALGTKSLNQQVASLRCGLGGANWVDASRWSTATEDDKVVRSAQIAQREHCKQLTGKDPASEGWLPFDLVKAHELYRALFDEVGDLVKDKQLLLVPSGPLTRLPFQVLVTEKPATAVPSHAEDYAQASWLIRQHGITVLSSVSSLKALRRDAKPSAATIPFIGFGNPLLLGSASNDKRAFAKQACSKKPQASPIRVALTVPKRRINLLRGGLGDVAVLRQQPPLPETADELCTIANEIRGTGRDVHLGAEATEREVKTLSAEGTLGNARVVQFATHGLLANETSRVANALDEPALLLTPPTTPTKEDDGLLTASEVSQLKLDADWVVLSACNTAGGGDDKNSEALSGLARAFFYAGARALLVSHWYVDSRAAVKLTTSAFAELERNPQIGRTEALRRAMLATMRDAGRPKTWTPAAHPAVWAPLCIGWRGRGFASN
jgi:CHAT domain-containing protein/tetratricopeptide (TPR) repeat protein